MLMRPCPHCNHPCRDWQPWRVSGELTISFICRCGHSWQINGCSVIFPPEGHAPEDFPPIAPCDLDPH